MFVLCVTLLFRVGIQLPTIEVRYENLMVDAKCFVGSRALPTLKNVTINILEVPMISQPVLPRQTVELTALACLRESIIPAQVVDLLYIQEIKLCAHSLFSQSRNCWPNFRVNVEKFISRLTYEDLVNFFSRKSSFLWLRVLKHLVPM